MVSKSTSSAAVKEGVSPTPNVRTKRIPKKSVEKRVSDILSQMTLEEKIDMLAGTGQEGGWFSSRGNERLGIPRLLMADGPVGVRWDKSTAFPAGIMLAASWDTALAGRYGRALARETKGHGRNVLLGPCVNIHRAPQGGRNFESFGEDPFLTSRITVAYIQAMQSENVIATVKHFACNNQEIERGSIDTIVDERVLHEIYFPAFRAAVQEAGCWAVMGAYNKVNGDWCCENHFLLTEVLKKRWGFQGLVMSDWGGVHSSVKTANAGLDLEMPDPKYLNREILLESVRRGEVAESVIDDKIRRIIRPMMHMGFFDNPPRGDKSVIGSAEHRNLACEVATGGMVLLKNEKSTLPLDVSRIRKIAVLGPNGAVARTGGGGSSFVNPVSAVSPLEGIRRRAGSKVEVVFETGCFVTTDLSPIESEYLFPADGKSGEHGLRAEYFDNMELKGVPAIRRIDLQVNMDWGQGGPGNPVPNDRFSARWTGRLVPPESGEYELGIGSDDGSRLYIDGKMIIDNWRDHGYEIVRKKIGLEAGRSYVIKMEYYENWGSAAVRLGWFRPVGIEEMRQKAIDAARNADAVIICAGVNANLESEGIDRADMELPAGQNELIEAVSRINPRTIIVLNSGAALLMNRWIEKVPSVIQAWYAGQEGGDALADVLFGDVNPSGKLPTTFLKSWEQSPAHKNYPGRNGMVKFEEGIFVGYRYFDQAAMEPLFPFGHGLSYTSFDYSNLKVTPSGKGAYEVSLELRNSGKRAGAEVVQFYLGDDKSSLPRPPKELKGFAKVWLKPGEKKRVAVRLGRESFAFYNPKKQDWTVEPGGFHIFVGSSSRDIRLSAQINIPQ